MPGLPLRITYTPALDASTRAELEALRLNSPSMHMPELAQIRGLDQVCIVRRLTSAMKAFLAQGEGGGGSLTEGDAATLFALSAR